MLFIYFIYLSMYNVCWPYSTSRVSDAELTYVDVDILSDMSNHYERVDDCCAVSVVSVTTDMIIRCRQSPS